jgi:hypothetical protein
MKRLSSARRNSGPTNDHLAIVAKLLTDDLPYTRSNANWSLSFQVTAHSGFVFNPTTGVDASLTGIGQDRPNVVGNPYVRNTNTLVWLNASAFVQNASGTYGNAGFNSLQGPSFFDIDTTLSRYFQIRERQRFELRFEFFNVLNHVNFASPVSNLHSSTFGQIQSAADPRILQLALKYQF